MGRNIVVIGLDAATFDIIKPLIGQGRLPVIASLISEGASGELQSALPPISSTAWTSFLTGMNPGKHGIFHFIIRRPDGHGFSLCNARDIKAQSIFSLISETGRNIGAVNIPMTYPPEEINGFIVSGIPVPFDARDYSYPRNLLNEINQEIGGYTVDCDFSSMNNHSHVPVDDLQNYDHLLENLMEIEDRRLKTTLYLMKKYPCDVFMVVLTLIDRVQHYFWRFMDKGHAGYTDEGAKRFSEVIFDCYERIDKMIGEIITASAKDTTFMIMSDHGAGPHYSDFHVNKWLQDIGWLKMKPCPRILWRKTNVRRILERLGLEKISKGLPPFVNSFSLYIPRVKRIKDFEDIDWFKTRAYSALSGININLKGRENRGLIEKGYEYQKTIQDLKAELCQLVDSNTGEPMIEKILEREEIFSGPFAIEGPDLLFQMKGMSCIPSDRYDATSWFETRVNHAISGTHRMNGIFIMKGIGIKKGVTLLDLHIPDVALTLIYLLQMSIPSNADGRVITEAFTPEFLKENRITLTEGKTIKRDVKAREPGFSEKEEQAVKESLKGLGYLS